MVRVRLAFFEHQRLANLHDSKIWLFEKVWEDEVDVCEIGLWCLELEDFIDTFSTYQNCIEARTGVVKEDVSR